MMTLKECYKIVICDVHILFNVLNTMNSDTRNMKILKITSLHKYSYSFVNAVLYNTMQNTKTDEFTTIISPLKFH